MVTKRLSLPKFRPHSPETVKSHPESNLALHLPTHNHQKLTTLLKCTSSLTMNHLFQLQAQLLISPPPYLDPNRIALKLITICSTHSQLHHASLIFSHHIPNPNLFVYNALLKAYAHNSKWSYTFHFFNHQLSSPTAPKPDEYTFTSVLKACAGSPSVIDGSKIHALVAKLGHQSNLFVCNSIIDMYFKFGTPVVAQRLFDEMTHRDIVSWNTLVSGYAVCGDVETAKRVFDEMEEKNLISWSAMIMGYARSGRPEVARGLFDEMPVKNAVVWNAMISGYAQNEKYSDAINLFRQMQQVGGDVRPNNVTLVSVLSACAHLGAIDLGKWIDRFIKRSGMVLNLFLGNALADMFAKCGCLKEARQIFDKMQEKDVISWSILISGLGMHGYAEEAFHYFSEMVRYGVKPNEVTFMGLLSACAHVGLVDQGLGYFNKMEKEYDISPKVEHYGCMVDLLSRSGRLNEAEDMITSMPMKPNVIVWGSLLSGCRVYRDVERGERVVQHILQLDPSHSGSYVFLANIYASTGRLEDAASCRLRMRDNGVMKVPGCSWIEVGNTVHEFFTGDRSHPQSEKIYLMISEIGSKMKLAGYKPNTDLVAHNVDEEEKEDAISQHSEKLAIAFGLISTREGTTIRIVKNLRVCTDCHEATKVISRIFGREIIVRDRSRFHLFKNGACSCNDYW